MSVYTYKCENCHSSFYTVGATDRGGGNGGESENQRRVRQLESGGITKGYNSRFCCEACAKEWQSKNPGKSTLDGNQKFLIGMCKFLVIVFLFFKIVRNMCNTQEVWLGAVVECIGESPTSFLCSCAPVFALVAFFVLKFKAKKIRNGFFRDLFNISRWLLLAVGLGLYGAGKARNEKEPSGDVKKADAEVQQVQLGDGSTPEAGDASVKNSAQVEKDE